MLARSITALLLLNGATAHAQSSREIEPRNKKLCLVNVGLKFPNIATITVTESRAVAASDKYAAAERLVLGLPDPKRGALELDAKFNFLDSDLRQRLDSRYAYLEQNLWKRVAALLGDMLAGAADVEVDARVLGQDATFIWTCIWNSQGSYFVTPMGVK
jgi:hypothetical protein